MMSNKTQKDEIKDLDTHKDDPILNLSAVAEALGRSPQTIGRWIEEGCLPSIVMPNGLRKVRKSALVSWIGVAPIGSDANIVKRVSKLSQVE